MTGPEHYREAERVIVSVTHRGALEAGDHAQVLALAQVHATLALAAATALNDYPNGASPEDLRAWRDLAETKAAEPQDGESR